MAEKRITKINIDGEEYSVGDGGGGELEKLKKYVRSTPDTEEGTSAQFGIFNDNHQTYIQIDRNKNQYNEYIDNITIDNNDTFNNFYNTKPNININAKSMNVNTYYGKICLDSDNKIIRIGDGSRQENENINVLTLGNITSYCLKNNNMLFIGKSNGVQNVNNSIIVTDDTQGYVNFKNSIVVGEDFKIYGPSVVMVGKGLKDTTSSNGSQQIIFGQYNTVDEYSVFQIGDGQGEDTRHNLFKINNSGKAYLSINKTGDLTSNGPGYVVRAPDENNLISSCWPFRISTSSGSTPVRLTYEKKGTTITSSFVVSAKNSNNTINSIKLTSNEDGTKTVALSDPDAWRSALVTDSDAWRSALGITDSTPSYFREKGSVSTGTTWKGLTLNSFPAEGIWVIIFKAYASQTDLSGSTTPYLYQQIKADNEILYEGVKNTTKNVLYDSDNIFTTVTVVHECTTSTKLECLVAKSSTGNIKIFYDVTGFKIS